MRNLWRSIVIFMITILAPLSAGHAEWKFGGQLSRPSVDEMQAKLDRLLNSALLPPFSKLSVAKLNEREGEMAGHKAYEIQFSITLGYSGDKLHCRSALCSELQNYSISIDEISKIATIKGWLFFEQTEQGWR
jgi:hypothetical protein